MTAKRLACVAMTMVVAVTTACSDGGTGPGTDTATFSADHSVYAPYETATLTLNGPAPTIDVTGTLGGETVTLIPGGDSTVLFMVPRVSGPQRLEFTVGSRQYDGTLTVTAFTPVAQPEAYLETVAEEAEALIAALELEIEQDTTPLDADAGAMLQMARDSLAAFRNHMSVLTPEQTQQVADIIRAGLVQMEATELTELRAGVVHFTAYGMIPTQCASLGTPLNKYSCTWRAFVVSAAKTAAALASSIGAGQIIIFPVVAAASSSFFAVYAGAHGLRTIRIGKELLKIHFMIAAEVASAVGNAIWPGGTPFFRATIVDDDVDFGGFGFASLALPPASMSSFTDRATASFTFQPQVRPVRPSDRLLPMDWLTKGLSLVTRYNRLVGRLSTRFQLHFAAPATSYLEPVPHNQISIEIVSGNVRVGHVGGEGSRVDVRFEATAAGEQDFTYDVIFTSGVFPALRVRYEATLHPIAYQLGFLADTTLVGDTVHMYGRTMNMFLLMMTDGTLAPDEGFHVFNDAQVPTHVNFNVTGNGGHYVYLQGWLRDPSMVADTFDVAIANQDHAGGQVQRLMNATVIMHDSVGVYASSLIGPWVRRAYDVYSNHHYRTETLVVNAGGTVDYRTTTYHTTEGDEVINDPRTHNWRIDVALEEGRPVHQFREHGDGWTRGMPVTWGAATFSYVDISFNERWVYSRN